MAKFSWNEITADDVIKAINLFESENPEYPEPRSTYLIYGNKKYPAKHIRGMAYRVHFGSEIKKSDYSGGEETVRFFSKLGFEMQYSHNSGSHYQSKKNKKTESDRNNHVANQSSTINIANSVSTDSSEKITIPTKTVIEQKNALQLLLNKLFDGDIVCEKTYPWMKTPSVLSGTYIDIHKALCAYRGNDTFAKKNVALRCDFVCESKKLIIEYDERQHFSEARRISLLSYGDMPLNYDKDLWIRACSDIQARDNQPINRDEIRAFYDSTRDIEAARHGYTLIRIMHGQIDFTQVTAMDRLRKLLFLDIKYAEENENKKSEYQLHAMEKSKPSLKIGLYLQTNELYGNIECFNEAMSIVRESDIDILVFPEFSYVPFIEEFNTSDFLNNDEVQHLYDLVLSFSRDIGKAVIVCNEDRYGTIMSIYCNALAKDNETKCKDYIKHTMTSYSACEIENYPQYAETAFQPIIYKGNRIGMTICYDCNHSIFSRKYGLNGIDIIINCTGGNVVYDKWYKYNKVRAIENNCFTFVTMGGDGTVNNPHNYVFGFTPSGKEMHPLLLNGIDNGRKNCSGGIYVYDTSENDGSAETDTSVSQIESINKNTDFLLPVLDINSIIMNGKHLIDGIIVLPHNSMNIVFLLLNEKDILKPECVLKLLYAKKLTEIPNKRYIIINRWNTIDSYFYNTHLSIVLKVRSMENFCAVVLWSENIKKCYQCGNNRTAQVLKPENGHYGIDLSRTSGPETIWRNKSGMKAAWRKNIEWLIQSM